jgi:hypothetical protein
MLVGDSNKHLMFYVVGIWSPWKPEPGLEEPDSRTGDTEASSDGYVIHAQAHMYEEPCLQHKHCWCHLLWGTCNIHWSSILYWHSYHHHNFCWRIPWLHWGIHRQRLHGIAISNGHYRLCCWTLLLCKMCTTKTCGEIFKMSCDHWMVIVLLQYSKLAILCGATQIVASWLCFWIVSQKILWISVLFFNRSYDKWKWTLKPFSWL